MKLIPLLRCKNMKQAIAFYTEILDFQLKYADVSEEDCFVDLINGEAEIQLTTTEGIYGIAVNVSVDEVDNLFQKYVNRGLIIPNNPNSPVHNSPIDQTWGTREFYVNDPSGNTLRFRKLIEL
jgi:uncharacterized glyoxalase superfamily protein PhnB